jgi:predicted phage terminase large subunit-like protein
MRTKTDRNLARALLVSLDPTSAKRRWATPGALAQHLDPHTAETPALELIDRYLVETVGTPNGRLIISMPPQEGKSQRVSRRFPTWLLVSDPDLRIAIASYEHRIARRWGKAVRDDLVSHKLLLVDQGSFAADEWTVGGHIGGIYSVGIGGALTGRPVDVLIVDDPIKDREQADSLVYRDRVWDWWTDVAVTRLAPGAPVVLILTRWHEDDLAGRLVAADDGATWRVLNIPAQADHDPAKGESDVLGREPGEWMVSARGRTPADWEAKRVAVGTRTFTSLYQGRPSPDAGDVFHRDWWRRFSTPVWWQEIDGSYHANGLVWMSWDMTFKDTKSSDFVVGQVWVQQGARAWLVDQVHARLSFTDTVAALLRMTAKWPQAHMKLVEDKANGTAVIDILQSKIVGIVAVTPHESKYARASAVSPLVEAGNVWLPERAIALYDVEGLIEECASFPNATHDDQVDALSQALTKVLIGSSSIIEWDEPMPKALDGSTLKLPLGRLAIDWADSYDAAVIRVDPDQGDDDYLY